MEVFIRDRRESDGVGFFLRDNAAKTIGCHSFYARLSGMLIGRDLAFLCRSGFSREDLSKRSLD